MADHSFDIVAEMDMAEVQNAHQMALKQIATRYDFKGKVAQLELDKTKKTVVATGADDYIVGQMLEIFHTALAKRGVDLKALKESSTEPASGGGTRKTFALRDTMEQAECKKITKALKEAKLKVNASIQGTSVRVSAKSKDDLQAVQKLVRELNLDAPVRFTNYK